MEKQILRPIQSSGYSIFLPSSPRLCKPQNPATTCIFLLTDFLLQKLDFFFSEDNKRVGISGNIVHIWKIPTGQEMVVDIKAYVCRTIQFHAPLIKFLVKGNQVLGWRYVGCIEF